MTISVQMDDRLAESLAAEVKRTGQTRNALIKIAIRQYLQASRQSAWPQAVLDHCQNEPGEDFAAFESYRQELAPPREIEF